MTRRIAMAQVELPNETKAGVAHQVHYFANVMAERGHDVTLFTFSPSDATCKYKVHTLPDSGKLKQFRPFQFAFHLARTNFSNFDILHAHGDDYLIRTRTPHLRTFYGSAKDEMRTAERLRRKIFQAVLIYCEHTSARVADRSAGISRSTKEYLPCITDIIPCGVDTSAFSPGAKEPDPAILFVGTHGGRKRGQFLADVFVRDVLSRVPSAKLWTVAEKDITGANVINFGRVSLDTLTDLYRRAWVFCLPSTYEGFGVPYIEAMASGTVAVATPNPGANEVLDNGTYGVLAPDAALGETLVSLLLDAEKRTAFTVPGLERVKEFAWSRIAERYEQVYDEMLTKRQNGASVR